MRVAELAVHELRGDDPADDAPHGAGDGLRQRAGDAPAGLSCAAASFPRAGVAGFLVSRGRDLLGADVFPAALRCRHVRGLRVFGGGDRLERGETKLALAIADENAVRLFWIDFALRVCMNFRMKTITLDDDAYERLKSWKHLRGDSFSAVVKRVVPRAGTLAAMASFAAERASSVEGRDELLESTVESRSAAKHDPWI